MTRRSLGYLLLTAGAWLLAAPLLSRLMAQEQPPTRRDLKVQASDFRFSPERLEVTQNDLVRVTVTSGDVAYSFTIDEYRVSKRVPAGESIAFEFRADRSGTFAFYSNMTSDPRHQKMRGQLVVRQK
jgi:heme/copper-type cytochrome/quinol oxidase subunit 2